VDSVGSKEKLDWVRRCFNAHFRGHQISIKKRGRKERRGGGKAENRNRHSSLGNEARKRISRAFIERLKASTNEGFRGNIDALESRLGSSEDSSQGY